MPKKVVVYDWFEDFQMKICEKLSVDEQTFYDMRKNLSLKEGERRVYINLWHYALNAVIPENMRNDTTVTLYQIDEDSIEEAKYEEQKQFLQAYREIMSEIDPKETGVLVEFSW